MGGWVNVSLALFLLCPPTHPPTHPPTYLLGTECVWWRCLVLGLVRSARRRRWVGPCIGLQAPLLGRCCLQRWGCGERRRRACIRLFVWVGGWVGGKREREIGFIHPSTHPPTYLSKRSRPSRLLLAPPPRPPALAPLLSLTPHLPPPPPLRAPLPLSLLLLLFLLFLLLLAQ